MKQNKSDNFLDLYNVAYLSTIRISRHLSSLEGAEEGGEEGGTILAQGRVDGN